MHYIIIVLVVTVSQAFACKKGEDPTYNRHYKDYHKTYIANAYFEAIEARVTADRRLLTSREIEWYASGRGQSITNNVL